MKEKRAKRPAAGRTRTYDPAQTRNSIIAAGLKLFKEGGFLGTAVNDIVMEAGVTKGAFYHHFESKEDLLLLIHNDYLEYQLEVIKEVLAVDASPTEQLKTIISVILAAIDKYHENVAIFFQERRYLDGPKFEDVRTRRNELEDVFRNLLEEGARSGEFRADFDVPITGLALIGMCAWTYQWYKPNGRLALPEIARNFTNLALQGVTANPA